MPIHVTRSSMPPFEEYCAEIRALWDSHWLTNMGEKHNKFQEALETYLGVGHVSLFANGHLALENVLAALGFPRGAEVVTTPFTFASTTHAIVRAGLIPVFCDVRDDDGTLDPAKLEALVTERTAAIVPVHVYGNLCDTDAIQMIADRHGLKVVYDAAHAFGVTKNGVSAAALGDAAIFSFHAAKAFHSVEGGAVCCRDASLAERLERLKNFGFAGEDCPDAGGNAKMSEFHAAMGLCNLRHLDGELAKRAAAAARYRERLSDVPGIRLLCPERAGVKRNYAYFPVVFEGAPGRDAVLARLAENDVHARKYFYPLTSAFSCYKDLPTARPEETPAASYLAAQVLCLPLYAELGTDGADRICDMILSS